MDKLAQLQRTKLRANLLLITGLLLYLSTLFLPQSLVVQALKAMTEAGMVGGLADWFAVSALFHKIPLPFIKRHTGIISNNKSRIADSLGQFIRERFFHPQALHALVQRYDLIQMLADWLNLPANAKKVALVIQQICYQVTAKQPRELVANLAIAYGDSFWQTLNLRVMLTNLFEKLVRDNRQQALLDFALRQLSKLLQNPASRHYLAEQIARWFSHEYPVLARLLSTQWLGKKGALKISDLVDKILLDIAEDKNHQLREKLNRGIQHFVYRLKHDSHLQKQVETFLESFRNDPAVTQSIKTLFSELYSGLHQVLAPDNSLTTEGITKIVTSLAGILADDVKLRAKFSQHLQGVLLRMAPALIDLLTRHISKTIQQWDDKELNRQIELNIGNDLQFIRINGTLVGACIGLLLFLISQGSFWFTTTILHTQL